MQEQITMKRKELESWLKERERWFIDNGNPFQEATMVAYIQKGLKKLHEMNLPEDKMIIMYDQDNQLMFKEEA